MTVLNSNKRFALNATLTALLASGLLVACGGGGGGSTTATAPVVVPPVVATSTLVTSVPAATYTGEFANAFNLINAERGACGFGLLAQNAALDAAAMSHASYLRTSGVVGEDLHAEVSGRAGFTGVSQTDRAKAKGYVGTVTEVIASGTGTTAVRTILSAPYHLNALMDGYRDVGIGMLVYEASPNNSLYTVTPGFQAGSSPQMFASSDVVTYPCNGSTGLNFQMRGEIPNPIPGRDLAANPIGTPILIKVRDGNVLFITNAAMINVATGGVVVLRAAVTSANDPNRLLQQNSAYVAPDAPLLKGTAYQATIAGTNNGVPFSRTINFTTGTGVN